MKTFKQYLNEKSLYDLSFGNVVDKQVKNFIYSDAGDGFFDEYVEKFDLDSKDWKKIMKSDDFLTSVRNYIIDNVDDAMDNLYDVIKNNKVKIYRAMTVDDNWESHLLKQGKHLGIYWSWDEDSAEEHNGYDSSKRTILITSIINDEYVNWDETAQLNSDNALHSEREIRLFKNTPIKILSIKNRDSGDEIDISQIKNKTFYA